MRFDAPVPTVSRRASALAATALLALSACGSSTDAAPAGGGAGGAGGVYEAGVSASALPCDVDAVLAASCRTCHGATPAFGAPMPLVTYDDLHAPGKSDASKQVYELVGARIHDDAAPMPQPPNPRLGAGAAATLDAWIAAGAKAAPAENACAGADAGAPSDSGVSTTLSCTPDLSIRPQTPWTMPQNESDVYTCYGLDVPVTGARQVIAFSPHIDNTTIVHHVLLYQSKTAWPSTPAPCNGAGVAKNKLLYGWAPGGGNLELPADVGFPLSGTAHFIVQVHYNNVNALSGEVDTSGFDLCTTSEARPNAADVVAFGSTSFTIPAHASLDMTCDFAIPSILPTMHTLSAFPHMHQLGKLIHTTATPGGGGADYDLGGVDDWSFSNQVWFPMVQTIHPGDVVHTRCAWDNPTDAPVSYGEYTSDEMCYSFTMYWPKIDALPSWVVPASQSSCKPTP